MVPRPSLGDGCRHIWQCESIEARSRPGLLCGNSRLSVLYLHVGLHVVLIHDMLSLFIYHSILRMLSMHHGHVVCVTDLWRVSLLLSN